jgi:hypothetical protein
MNKRKLLQSKGFNQEYSVFTALAPENIVNLFNAQEISFPEYYKLLCLLTYLNLNELSYFHRSKPNYILCEDDKRIFEEGCDEEFEKLIEEKGWELDDDEYVTLFTENILNENLKKLFSTVSY